LLQKVVYAKASTKLSPSALIIKEAIMALINRSLSLSSIISVVNWHDNASTDDEVLKERIKRSIQYFSPTNNIMNLAWDNPFGFISLIYDYRAKDVFQYFFKHDGFSKILKNEIGKILKL